MIALSEFIREADGMDGKYQSIQGIKHILPEENFIKLYDNRNKLDVDIFDVFPGWVDYADDKGEIAIVGIEIKSGKVFFNIRYDSPYWDEPLCFYEAPYNTLFGSKQIIVLGKDDEGEDVILDKTGRLCLLNRLYVVLQPSLVKAGVIVDKTKSKAATPKPTIKTKTKTVIKPTPNPSEFTFKSIAEFTRALSEKEMIDILISNCGKRRYYHLNRDICDVIFKDSKTSYDSGVSVALGNEWNSSITGFYIVGNKLVFNIRASGDSTDEDRMVSYREFMTPHGSISIKFVVAQVSAQYDERTRLKIANNLFTLIQALEDGQKVIK